MPPSKILAGEDERLLGNRIRLGLMIMFAAVTLFAAVELIVRPGENIRVTLLQAACLMLLGVCLFATRRALADRSRIVIALLGFLVGAATSIAVALATGAATTSLIVFVAFAMGSAALVPWGWRAQSLACLGLGILFPIGAFFAESGIGAVRSRELAAFYGILLASVYIAFELERYRGIVTEERRARQRREADLEQQRTFLRQVIDIIPHLLFAKDHEGRFTLVNQAVADLYGTRIENLLGKTDADFNPNAAEVEQFRRDDLEVMSSLREKYIAEEQITDATGQRRTLETVKRALIAADGGADQLLGIATDISAHKRTEERLRSEADIAAALAHVGRQVIASLGQPDMLSRLCATAAGTLGFDNAALWCLDEDVFVPVAGFGGTAEDWEMVRVIRLPADRVAGLLNALETEDILPLELTEAAALIPPSLVGLTPGLVGIALVPLRRSQQITALIGGGYTGPLPAVGEHERRLAAGVAQITSLGLEIARLLQQLERANQLKSEFVATMSHELRTPLNVILGYVSLILDGEIGDSTDERNAVLARVHSSALQLHEMISSTLDISRLEAGRVPIELGRVDLGTLVAEIELQLRDSHAARGIALRCQVPPQTLVWSDAGKLKLILKNLISNAIKFTPNGTVEVAVEGQPQGELTLIVRDTGIGIPPEAQTYIFDAFRQADGSIGSHYGGVGLGLYIVRRLVETLGGSIQLDSEVGRGSTFRIRLPGTEA